MVSGAADSYRSAAQHLLTLPLRVAAQVWQVMLHGTKAKPGRVGTSLATQTGVGRPHALTSGAVGVKHLSIRALLSPLV